MIDLLNFISLYIYIFFEFHFLRAYFFMSLGAIFVLYKGFRKGDYLFLTRIEGDNYKIHKWQK